MKTYARPIDPSGDQPTPASRTPSNVVEGWTVIRPNDAPIDLGDLQRHPPGTLDRLLDAAGDKAKRDIEAAFRAPAVEPLKE